MDALAASSEGVSPVPASGAPRLAGRRIRRSNSRVSCVRARAGGAPGRASQLGIDVSLLTAVFLILFASTLGGVALAFGLGARGVVGNILAMHYVNKSYGIGQLVRVGEHEGRIVRRHPSS